MTGHVFISSSPHDAAYVRSLIEHLGRAGIRAWAPEGGGHADGWVQVVRPRIDTCAAFVAIMTPAAQNSGEVEQQVARAREMGKPILPLLRSGAPLTALTAEPYEDVTGGQMPGAGFVARLGEAVGQEPVAGSGGTAPSSGLGPGLRSGGGLLAAAALLLALAATVLQVVTFPYAWLEWVGVGAASAIALIGAFRARAWTFPATVAVIVSLAWISRVVLLDSRQSLSEESYTVWAYALTALLLGALYKSYSSKDYFVVRPLRVVAWVSIIALTAYGVAVGQSYGVLLGFAIILSTYGPYLVLLYQSWWERDRRVRGTSALSVTAYGALTSLALATVNRGNLLDVLASGVLLVCGLLAFALRGSDRS